jgi:hypothetical protein
VNSSSVQTVAPRPPLGNPWEPSRLKRRIANNQVAAFHEQWAAIAHRVPKAEAPDHPVWIAYGWWYREQQSFYGPLPAPVRL